MLLVGTVYLKTWARFIKENSGGPFDQCLENMQRGLVLNTPRWTNEGWVSTGQRAELLARASGGGLYGALSVGEATFWRMLWRKTPLDHRKKPTLGSETAYDVPPAKQRRPRRPEQHCLEGDSEEQRM